MIRHHIVVECMNAYDEAIKKYQNYSLFHSKIYTIYTLHQHDFFYFNVNTPN